MPEGSSQIKSMTAFGRGVSDFPIGRITIEIQSVNRRFLEVNVGVPRLFLKYEMDIRKWVAEKIGRGTVTVSLNWKMNPRHTLSIAPNLSLARALKGAWDKLATDLGLEKHIPVALLLQEKELFVQDEELANEEVYSSAVKQALQEALNALFVMKQKEGKVLAHDLHERLRILRKEIGEIEARSGQATDKYRQKLLDRLKELFSGTPENEEKVLREIAIYAERVDITEEIVRFKSHLEQFGQTLNKPVVETGESLGKTLDFLLQELHREVNTIGSKASDLSVSQRVVTIKSELERIREQVQNIE
jgi:uncharacterized protein (TIGR00255 family)